MAEYIEVAPSQLSFLEQLTFAVGLEWLIGWSLYMTHIMDYRCLRTRYYCHEKTGRKVMILD